MTPLIFGSPDLEDPGFGYDVILVRFLIFAKIFIFCRNFTHQNAAMPRETEASRFKIGAKNLIFRRLRRAKI